MGRVSVQVCPISARGLRASPSLWKHHWFAVGWMDCSGYPNPVWNTKFSALVDDSEFLTLHVQVYSRDPFFFTKRLQGSATVSLSEFLWKRNDRLGNGEGVRSYHPRKNDSGKPRGFVNDSVCVMSENGDEPHFYPE